MARGLPLAAHDCRGSSAAAVPRWCPVPAGSPVRGCMRPTLGDHSRFPSSSPVLYFGTRYPCEAHGMRSTLLRKAPVCVGFFLSKVRTHVWRRMTPPSPLHSTKCTPDGWHPKFIARTLQHMCGGGAKYTRARPRGPTHPGLPAAKPAQQRTHPSALHTHREEAGTAELAGGRPRCLVTPRTRDMAAAR